MELTNKEMDKLKKLEFDIARMERLKLEKANEPSVVEKLEAEIKNNIAQIDFLKQGIDYEKVELIVDDPETPIYLCEKPSVDRTIEMDTFDIDTHLVDMDFSKKEIHPIEKTFCHNYF